jgi:steroid delta-isomerase-like uncharacterized protein
MAQRDGVSRRTACVQLGAAGLAAGFLKRVPTPALARAREATPGTDERGLPTLLVAYEAAWAAHDDGSQLASLFTEDGVFEDTSLGIVARGRAEIAGYVLTNYAAFPDLATPTTAGLISGNHAAIEFTYSGTYTGQFPGLPPGEGQSVSFRGSHFMDLQGEQIRSVRSYYNLYALLVQIGLLPPPEASATPAP